MSVKRPFRFGLVNQSFSDAASWRERAKKAEALGFSTFLIRDHIASDHFGVQFAPFTALAVAAGATSAIRLGTYMIDNDFRHPSVLAKEAATLDLLSGGRFELGLGAGWLASDYRQSGIPFDSAGVRLSRMEESIAILKGLFRGDAVDFAGEHYRVEGLRNYPAPSGLPLVIGGGRKRVLAIAGREATTAAIMTSTLTTSGSTTADPDERRTAGVRARVEWVREGAGARFDEVELATGPDIILTNDRAARTEELIVENGWAGMTPADIDDMPLTLIGSLEQIAEGIERARDDFGFSYFILGDDHMDELAPLVTRLSGR